MDDAEKLLGYLGESGKILRKFEETILGLPENFQLLVVEETSNRFSVLKNLVLKLQDFGYNGLIVSLNLPVFSLLNRFKKENISPEKLVFVDGITSRAKNVFDKTGNTIFLDSLKDLVEISVSIDKAVSMLETKKNFLVFDSITTLLVYNDSRAVEKFVHNLIGKMRAKSIASVFFVSPNADKEVIDSIAEFCDSSIKIN